jgi:hypothetical protein
MLESTASVTDIEDFLRRVKKEMSTPGRIQLIDRANDITGGRLPLVS